MPPRTDKLLKECRKRVESLSAEIETLKNESAAPDSATAKKASVTALWGFGVAFASASAALLGISANLPAGLFLLFAASALGARALYIYTPIGPAWAQKSYRLLITAPFIVFALLAYLRLQLRSSGQQAIQGGLSVFYNRNFDSFPGAYWRKGNTYSEVTFANTNSGTISDLRFTITLEGAPVYAYVQENPRAILEMYPPSRATFTSFTDANGRSHDLAPSNQFRAVPAGATQIQPANYPGVTLRATDFAKDVPINFFMLSPGPETSDGQFNRNEPVAIDISGKYTITQHGVADECEFEQRITSNHG